MVSLRTVILIVRLTEIYTFFHDPSAFLNCCWSCSRRRESPLFSASLCSTSSVLLNTIVVIRAFYEQKIVRLDWLMKYRMKVFTSAWIWSLLIFAQFKACWATSSSNLKRCSSRSRRSNWSSISSMTSHFLTFCLRIFRKQYSKKKKGKWYLPKLLLGLHLLNEFLNLDRLSLSRRRAQ